MFLIRTGLLTITVALLAACSVDLGTRERAPEPDYPMQEMHDAHHGSGTSAWCCQECDLSDEDVVRCSGCRQDRPSSCPAGETTLVCRDSYTEEGARRDRTVACF